MLISLFLIVIDIVLSIAGQLLLKSAMTQVNQINRVASLGELAERLGWMGALVVVFTTPIVIVAVGIYALAFAAWLVALSRLNLSYAYPLLAATYVVIPIASWLLLGEQVPLQRWAGIAIVTAGILVVGRS